MVFSVTIKPSRVLAPGSSPYEATCVCCHHAPDQETAPSRLRHPEREGSFLGALGALSNLALTCLSAGTPHCYQRESPAPIQVGLSPLGPGLFTAFPDRDDLTCSLFLRPDCTLPSPGGPISADLSVGPTSNSNAGCKQFLTTLPSPSDPFVPRIILSQQKLGMWLIVKAWYWYF